MAGIVFFITTNCNSERERETDRDKRETRES